MITSERIQVIWFSPVFITVFGYFWSRPFVWRSVSIGRYIKELEANLALRNLGWEQRVDKNRINYDAPINFVWFSLLLVSIWLGLQLGSGYMRWVG
jgi:hypothetical protein